MDYQKIFDQHLKKIRKFPELDFFFRNQTRYLILLLACVDYASEKKIIKNFNITITIFQAKFPLKLILIIKLIWLLPRGI